jgi:hypothetical protein
MSLPLSASILSRATKGFFLLLASLTLIRSVTAGPVTITRGRVGNVDAGQFSVFWQVNDATVPRLDIFSNAAGTISLNGQLGVEFYPLEMNEVTVAQSFSQRAGRRELQATMRANGIVYARVTGARAGSTYFIRPRSFDGNGVANEEAPAALIPVTTPAETAFVIESRQLRVSGECVAGSGGMVMQLSMAGAPYPLLSVVGEAELPRMAIFDLSRLLNAAGTTNAALIGTPQFTLELLAPAAPLNTSPASVPYSSTFTVASLTDTAYFVIYPGLAHFTVEAVNPPLQGAPFLLNVTARTSNGDVLTDYNGNVIIITGAAGDLFEGAGATRGFVNGVLAGYHTVPAIAGPLTLTATRPCGAETGSGIFNVTALNLTTWRQHHFGADAGNDTIAGLAADPDFDDLTNGAEYFLGRHPRRFDVSPFHDTDEDGELVFHYWRGRLSPGVSSQPVWGGDLSLSRTDLVTQEILETSGAFQLIRVRIATGSLARCFAGLRVTQP